jgi:hypothetical protein
MKKIFVAAIMTVILGTATQAQTQRDWYIIGGDLSNIGLDFQDGNTNFSLDITPRAAWFIRDDFAVGGEALLGLSTGDGFTTTTYGIGPIARYYLSGTALESVRRTRWFLDGNVGIYGTNTKVSGQEGVSTNGLGIGFGPGIAYFLNPNIALEAVAKYNIAVGFGNSTTSNRLNFGLGFQIHLPTSRIRAIQNDVK